MQFKDIIGQSEIKALITRNIREGRIAHAQLYWGGEGVGKLALAIATIQYLNCENPSETDSCGECAHCRLISSLTHPDVHFAFPIAKEGTKTTYCEEFLPQWRSMILDSPYFNLHQWMQCINMGGKVGSIYTSESEAIAQSLSLKSHSARYKSVIIWLPEKMQEQAANKLLKLIEEPPHNTIFFLVSEHPEQLLPTITSRVQATHIKNILPEDLQKYFTPDIARIAGGDYIAAKELSDSSSETSSLVQRYRELMVCAFKKDIAALKEFAELSATNREETLVFLDYACRLTREIFIANLCNTKLSYSRTEENQFIEKFKTFIKENNIESVVDNLTRAYQDIERNANIKLTIFDMGLQLFTLIKAH